MRTAWKYTRDVRRDRHVRKKWRQMSAVVSLSTLRALRLQAPQVPDVTVCSGESLYYSACSSTPSATGTDVTECSGESLYYSACSSTPSATGTDVTECSGKSLYYSACSSTPSATGTDVTDSETGGCSNSGSLWQHLKCAKP